MTTQDEEPRVTVEPAEPQKDDTTALRVMQVGRRGVSIDNYETLWKMAQMIHKSGLAPKSLGSASKIAAAIQTGLELDVPPMAALRGIAVINGTPTIYGDLGTALVRSSGELEDFVEYFEGSPYEDDFTAVCSLKRRGVRTAVTGRFSVGDAKSAHLWEKRGYNGKETPWITYPKRMLMWRARSWAYRDGFADVLSGLMFFEEARDIPTREPREVEFEEPIKPDFDVIAPKIPDEEIPF